MPAPAAADRDVALVTSRDMALVGSRDVALMTSQADQPETPRVWAELSFRHCLEERLRMFEWSRTEDRWILSAKSMHDEESARTKEDLQYHNGRLPDSKGDAHN